jgi:hypothetical protein
VRFRISSTNPRALNALARFSDSFQQAHQHELGISARRSVGNPRFSWPEHLLGRRPCTDNMSRGICLIAADPSSDFKQNGDTVMSLSIFEMHSVELQCVRPRPTTFLICDEWHYKSCLRNNANLDKARADTRQFFEFVELNKQVWEGTSILSGVYAITAGCGFIVPMGGTRTGKVGGSSAHLSRRSVTVRCWRSTVPSRSCFRAPEQAHGTVWWMSWKPLSIFRMVGPSLRPMIRGTFRWPRRACRTRQATRSGRERSLA